MVMLGASCSQCCKEKECDCSLPGTNPAAASNSARGLVWLEFTSCIGSGAAGTVTAPEAASPCDYEGLAGPITGATVTNGGSGYARLGRVAPTVTASAGGGTGATLGVTLQQGTESLCSLSVPFWSVASVSVTNGGSGYADGALVTFTATSGTAVSAATGTARVVYDEPKNAVFNIATAGGSGAVLEPVWELLPESEWPAPHKKTYRLASVTVVNGGTGYADLEQILISFPSAADGVVQSQAIIDTDYVGTGGVIQQVYIADPVTLAPGPAGEYVGSPTDELHSVVVTNAGNYYLEDASVSPYVPGVTVTVHQEAPSTGSGAVITATVEDDTASPDFGKIVGLTVVNGGTGYLSVPLECSLPDKLYITFGSKTAEVPIAPAFVEYLPGYYTFTPGEFGASFPTTGQQDYSPDAMVGLCNEGDCCVNIDPVASVEAAEEKFGAILWKSFSQSFAMVVRPTHHSGASPGALALACHCEKHLVLIVSLTAYCVQYVPTGPTFGSGGAIYAVFPLTRKAKTFRYCVKFDKDANGCAVGDGTVISTTIQENDFAVCGPLADWYGNTVTDCTCNQGCFDGLTPQVSLMPP